MADTGDVTLEVETEGVRRQVRVTVSPPPADPDGWGKVIRALYDYVREHPEWF